MILIPLGAQQQRFFFHSAGSAITWCFLLLCFSFVFGFRQSYSQSWLLFPELLGSFLRRSLPLRTSYSVFSTLSSSSFRVSGLMFRPLIHLNWFLYRVRDQVLALPCCPWMPSFPSTVGWRGCLFFNGCLWQRCLKSCLKLTPQLPLILLKPGVCKWETR